jgi:hypothetical protein
MLTKKLLEQLDACTGAIKFCQQYNLFGMPLAILDKIEGDHLGYVRWFTDRKFELSDGNVLRIDDSSGYWKTNEYLDGNVLRSDDSNGYWRTTEYLDGLVIRTDNSYGDWKTFEYQDGLVIRTDTSTGCDETFKYWPSGQLKQIKDMYIPLII